MFEGSVIEIPLGRAGLNRDANAREIPPTALIVAEGVDFHDGVLRKEGGAVSLDDAGVGASPTVAATLDAPRGWVATAASLIGAGTPAFQQGMTGAKANDTAPNFGGSLSLLTPPANPAWEASLVAYKTDGPAAFVKEIGTAVGGIASSLTVTVPVGGVAAGNTVVLTIGGKATASPVVAVTDSKGNVYSIDATRVQTVGSLVSSVVTCSGRVTTPLVAGDTIRATLAPYLLGAGMAVCEYSGIAISRFDAQQSATGVSSFVSTGAVVPNGSDTDTDSVCIGSLHTPSSATLTPTGSFTTRSTASSTAPVRVVQCSRIVRHPSTVAIVVPVGGIAAGRSLVVSAALFTILAGQPTTATCTDEAGNAYTQVAVSDAVNTVNYTFIAANIVNPLTAGQKILIRFTGRPYAVRAGVASEWTNLAATPLDRVAKAQGGSTSIMVPIAALSSVPQVVIGTYSLWETGSVATTPGNGFTEAGEVAQGTVRLVQQYLVVTSTDDIIALYDWHPDAMTQKVVTVTSGGAVYKSDDPITDLDAVTMATGLSGSSRGRFIQGGKETAGDKLKLFYVNGTDAVRYVNGDSDTLSTITPPADFTTSTTAAQLTGSETETFDFSSGGNETLVLSVDGGPDQTFTFPDGAFANAAAATLAEVRTVVDATITGATTSASAGALRITSATSGLNSRLTIRAGTANVILGFTNGQDVRGTGPYQPLNGIVHNNKLWLFGNTNRPHTAYISKVSAHHDFSDNDVLTVHTNIGARLVGSASFQGKLYLWKYPVGLFEVDDADLLDTNWRVRVVSEALGCAQSPAAVLPIDNDALFLTQDGRFHLLSAVDTPSGTRASDLAEALRLAGFFRESLNLARLDQCLSVWDPGRKIAYFSLPGAGETRNTLMVKFDFSGERPKCSVSRRDVPDALTDFRDSDGVRRPLLGEGNHVFKLDQAERTKLGAGYRQVFQIPHLDFGATDEGGDAGEAGPRATRMNLQHVELLCDPTGTVDDLVTVEVFLDERETPSQAIVCNTATRRQRRKLFGNCHTVSVRVTQDGPGAEVKAEKLLLSVTPSDEAARA